MKKLVGLAVALAALYFLGTTLMEEFVGQPPPAGETQSLKPGLRDKAANAGAADRKKKADKLNAIGED